MPTERKNLTAFFYKSDDGFYIAHCLEYSLVAQAEKAADLPAAFALRVISHIVSSIDNKQEPFAHLRPAPKHIVKMAKQAKWRSERHADVAQVAPASVPSKFRRNMPALEFRHSLALV